MREAIGGTWLTQLVIVFMLIFVAFLALSLNYTKAFKMKNEVLTIIEKYEGLTTSANANEQGSIKIINKYLQNNGYRIMKSCPEGSYGASNLNEENPSLKYIVKGDKNKYYYCVTKMKKKENDKNTKDEGKAYYKVNLFLYFNLPVLGDIFTFDINGTTGDIVIPADELRYKE